MLSSECDFDDDNSTYLEDFVNQSGGSIFIDSNTELSSAQQKSESASGDGISINKNLVFQTSTQNSSLEEKEPTLVEGNKSFMDKLFGGKSTQSLKKRLAAAIKKGDALELV